MLSVKDLMPWLSIQRGFIELEYIYTHQVFGHVFLGDKVARGPVGVNQVPVVVNVHCVPAVVVFGALELVAGAVVQTLGKSCQHRTEQAGIPTARVISLYSTEILQHFKVIIWTQFFYLKIYKSNPSLLKS